MVDLDTEIDAAEDTLYCIFAIRLLLQNTSYKEFQMLEFFAGDTYVLPNRRAMYKPLLDWVWAYYYRPGIDIAWVTVVRTVLWNIQAHVTEARQIRIHAILTNPKFPLEKIPKIVV